MVVSHPDDRFPGRDGPCRIGSRGTAEFFYFAAHTTPENISAFVIMLRIRNDLLDRQNVVRKEPRNPVRHGFAQQTGDKTSASFWLLRENIAA